MDTKHTPGAWTAEKLGEFAPESERMITADLGHTDTGIRLVRSIARTLSNAGAEQALANARLIAAAPELLQCVIDAIPHGVSTDNKNIPDSQVIPVDMTIGQIRRMKAAFKKATQP